VKSFLFRQLEPLSILKKIVKLVASLILGFVAFAVYCFFTPNGTQIALLLMAELSPYEITFSESKGSFGTMLKLKDVSINSAKFTLKAASLDVDWDWLQFISNRTINRIVAKQADITIVELSYPTKVQTAATQNLGSTLVDVKTEIHKIPVPFKIANIELENSVVHWEKQDHHIDKLVLMHTDTQLDNLFQEVHYKGSAGTLDATIADTVNIHWDLQLVENSFFSKYFSGNLTTKGHILFLKNQLESDATKLTMKLQASKINVSKPIENVSLHLHGTLAAHAAVISSHVDGYPVKTILAGELHGKKWTAKMNELVVKHERWDELGKTQGTFTIDWHHPKHILASIDALLWDRYPLAVALKAKRAKPYALSGTIQTQIKEIKTLAPLIPDIKSWRAKCNVNLTVGGNLTQPEITGDILLKEVKLRHFVWGSKATISQLNIHLLANKLIKIMGEGTWGSGPFSLKGEGSIKNGNPVLALNLKGENLLLSDTPEYYILANPDLTLTLKEGEPVLSGTILIPQAEIQSLKNPDMVTTSGDVVIVSKQAPKAKPLNQRSIATGLTTNIEIILGKKISYKGHGFTAGATGKLLIRQTPGQMPNAKGQIDLINGKYRGYGQTFDIDHGQLVFSGGPINDPLLDIRAQRKIAPSNSMVSAKSEQVVTAGLKFHGNLKSPKIDFYSSPAMSDADVISYLVIGRPQSQVSEAQGELLLQAASELVSVVGNGRKDVQLNFAERLKLDKFGFTKKINASGGSHLPGHNPLEDTAFTMGKQLSDRLYLHYSLGLVDSANNFGLRYILGKHLTLEASTGTEGSSADVLLSFEGH
jgi:autotransporter translocation and assembly factor TamB